MSSVDSVGPSGPQNREAVIAHLTDAVLPVLEQSKAALAKDGVAVAVEASWADPTGSGEPLVRFHCGRRGLGSAADLPHGNVAEFGVSNGMLTVVTAAGRDTVGADDEERAIEQAVAHTVSRYYADLEDTVR